MSSEDINTSERRQQEYDDQTFEPRIIAFLCNWCTYAGADLAGTSRVQYPSNIRIIRLMCSGSLDSTYVIKALLEGADGVLIGGCHPGDCHYINGNLKARRRVAILKSVLKNAGLDPERVWLRWISASEGAYFAETVREMVEHIRDLGPNPLKTEWGI
ncbi:hydrogenase iron-sulfur subunit [Candidatus Poribacteria bacterium]